MESNSNQKEEIERFSVSVPKEIYEAFEDMRKQIGVSRSQAIRNAMHLFIEKETQNPDHDIEQIGDKFTLGTIYLLMKHSDWGITNEHVHEEPHIFSEAPSHSYISQTRHVHHEESEEHQHIQKNSPYSHSQFITTENEENLDENHQEQGWHVHKDNQFEKEDQEIEPKMRYINVLEADVLKNMEIQHEFHDVIVSVTHIHAEHDICLETLIVKGKISRIKTLYSKLRKLRSIIDIRLFIALSH